MRDDVARALATKALEVAQKAKSQQGAKGEKGDPGQIIVQPNKGDQGEQGPMGPQGIPGKSILGPKGDKGDKGDTGLKGDKGDQGAAGKDGAQGERGERGFTGLKGASGSQGSIGPMPKHEKKGLMIRFEKEPGVFGEWIIMPTSGGGGGGRDDKLTDRQAELVALAEFYKTRSANANKFIKTDGTSLAWDALDGSDISGGTITSTRINPRVVSIASSATITPTGDTADQYNVTALAVPVTIAIPSGTPVDGQKLVIRIEDNGTARALTWTTSAGGYRVIGSTLPTTTVATKNLYVGCIYNSNDSFWDVVAVAQQV